MEYNWRKRQVGEIIFRSILVVVSYKYFHIQFPVAPSCYNTATTMEKVLLEGDWKLQHSDDLISSQYLI